MGSTSSSEGDGHSLPDNQTTTIPMNSTRQPSRPRKTAWPILTVSALVLYCLVLTVYLAWPMTLLNINWSNWPFLVIFMYGSLVKVLVPIVGIFLATMHTTYPDLLGLFGGLIGVALVDSVALIIILVVHLLRANTASGYNSYGNDLLYCCQYAGMAPSCPANYGPCSAFSGILRLNIDIVTLLSFSVIFLVLEILCLLFMIGLYNTHSEKSSKFSWKKLVNQDVKSTLTKAPTTVLHNAPLWLQQIDRNLAALVYGSRATLKKHGKVD